MFIHNLSSKELKRNKWWTNLFGKNEYFRNLSVDCIKCLTYRKFLFIFNNTAGSRNSINEKKKHKRIENQEIVREL